MIARNPHFTEEKQQSLLDDPRGRTLDDRNRSAKLLHAALRKLSERQASRRKTLYHGDYHAGNLFLMPEGPGFTDWQLVQRGHWTLDVAHHMSATC